MIKNLTKIKQNNKENKINQINKKYMLVINKIN